MRYVIKKPSPSSPKGALIRAFAVSTGECFRFSPYGRDVGGQGWHYPCDGRGR